MTPALRLPAAVAALLSLVLLAGAPATTTPRAAPGLHPPPQLATASVPDGWPSPPAASAVAYVLLDADTGQVLAERNADQRRPVASTVKVLTALTVLNRADASDEVRIPAAAARVGGASVGLRAGDVWTVGQLLDALVVRSGNDAATALAIHVGGSVEGFVALMRADARALGLDGLTLTSPSGLDDRNRLSARDLAVISRAAMTDPRFRTVAARRSADLPGPGAEETRNELLLTYPGATGIKTGFTDAAGYAVVGSAERAGRELIAVVLGSRSAGTRFVEAASLLDHGFDTFEVVATLYDARLRVAGGWVTLHAEPLSVTVPRATPGLTTILPLPIEPPPDGDERAVTVAWHGEELGTLDVRTTGPDVGEATGGGAIGRYLVDRAYAAMRAATSTGTWSR